jgi:hypothetical protein
MKSERLIQERSDSGRALAAFDARTAEATAGSEERSWRALQARLAAPPPSRRWLIWPLAALAGSAAAAVVIARFPATRPMPPLQAAAPSVAPAPLAVTPPAPVVEPPPAAFSARLRPLSGGPIRLADGTVLSLGHGARARGSQRAGRTQLVLESGTLKLAVAPGQPDGLSVRAGPYRFVDLGTVFRVTRNGRRVSLWVEEGMVAVWRDRQLLATVKAGGRWSSPAAAIAAGGTLVAETALYEQARLLAQERHDLPAALASLREHRRRFPHGALRAEVDLTLVELLPRLGRFREALDESAALLARDPQHERAAELRLLRGNILRESFNDYERAGLEYAAVREVVRTGESSAIADDAAFFEAVCLEVVRRDDAADAYRRYLAGRAPRHAAEARARLSAIVR